MLYHATTFIIFAALKRQKRNESKNYCKIYRIFFIFDGNKIVIATALGCSVGLTFPAGF